MLRRCAFFVVAILLLSSGAFAQIAQNEDFAIGSANLLVLASGAGSANGGNLATVGHGQFATKYFGLFAMQGENAMLNETACSIGLCGIFTATQEAEALGQQLQLLGGCCGPKIEGQILGVGLGQQVTKVGGVGGVSATHDFEAGQLQVMANPAGMMGECQSIDAAQHANVAGLCGSGAIVVNGILVGATQSQVGN